VRIEFTPTYTAVKNPKPTKDRAQQAYVFRPEDFRFEFCQKKGLIRPRETQGKPIYDDGGFSGAEVWLECQRRNVRTYFHRGLDARQPSRRSRL